MVEESAQRIFSRIEAVSNRRCKLNAEIGEKTKREVNDRIWLEFSRRRNNEVTKEKETEVSFSTPFEQEERREDESEKKSCQRTECMETVQKKRILIQDSKKRKEEENEAKKKYGKKTKGNKTTKNGKKASRLQDDAECGGPTEASGAQCPQTYRQAYPY